MKARIKRKVGYKWDTINNSVMDGVKFEFNDSISYR